MGLIRAIRGAINRRKTDRQVIVVFQDAGKSLDVIYRSAKAIADLAWRQGIPTVTVFIRITSKGTLHPQSRQNLAKALAALTNQSRIYLDGHGDWQSQSLGDWGWKEVADLLGECGMPSVRLVSILGCELGRDLGTSNDQRIGHSVNCFASNLHQRLKDSWSIETVVHARVFLTGTFDSRSAPLASAVGHKYTFNEDDEYDDDATARHRTHSKRRFYWEQGVQKVEWAY